MINKFSIENLTVFSNVELQFASGLNVIIGENGCGKSNILKTMYSIVSTSFAFSKGETSKQQLNKKLALELTEVTRAESIGRLVKRAIGQGKSRLSLEFEDTNANLAFSFSRAAKSEVVTEKQPTAWVDKAPVYLPTRELLSIYPGFAGLYDGRYLEFEKTWRDTCLLLSVPALRGPREHTIAKLLKPLEDIMGGQIVLETNGRFYLVPKGQSSIEMPLVAEGLRKFAMIARLIVTGSLLDNGYLFWDEPESNLNPKLIKQVAETIFDLCQHGIQVFIATHSLFLLREISILQEGQSKKPAVDVCYFGLKKENNGNVSIEQGASIDDIQTIVALDEELRQSERYMEQNDVANS